MIIINHRDSILRDLFNKQKATRKCLVESLNIRRNDAKGLFDTLLKDNCVVEINPENRKNIHLKLNQAYYFSLGVEHTPEGFYYAILNSDLTMVTHGHCALNAQIDDGVARCQKIAFFLKQLIKDHIPENSQLFIGFVDVGMINKSKGESIRSARLPRWSHIPVVKILQDTLKNKVNLLTSADSQACAEKVFGQHLDLKDSFLYLHVDQGIGLSIVSKGNLYQSATIHGEIGHTVVNREGEMCACGNRGCLESIASIPSIISKIITHQQLAIENIIEKNSKISIIDQVISAVNNGNKLSILTIQEAATSIGEALAIAVNLLGITEIIIHSPLTKIEHVFMPPITTSLTKNCIHPLNINIKLHLSQLDEGSAALGAAYFSLHNHFNDDDDS